MSECHAPETYYSTRMYRIKGINTPVRCTHCGRAHVRGEAINPEMLPMGTGRRLSPWFPHIYRPHLPGYYECRFRSTEPRPVRLYWDGSRFLYDGQPVRMRDFMGYRGNWA